SRAALGHWMRRRGLFVTPTEQPGQPLLETLAAAPPLLPPSERPALELALIDPRRNAVHIANARAIGGLRVPLLAAWRERLLKEGPAGLTGRQLDLLLRDRASLRQLHEAVWHA